ncbi:histidinol dehydrogenase, partial [uncultured Clostridium sp.]
MMDIIELNNKNISDIVSIIKKRSNTLNIRKGVEDIIKNVRSYGDKALRDYTLDFDKVYIEKFKVEEEEIDKAYNQCDLEFIEILKESIENIKKYHEKQKKTSYIYQKELGIYMGQRLIPMDSVAIYVPGGKAAYPSSVLMNAIPAQVAGVKEIVLVTPPNKDGKINKQILVAAKLCGINKIYKLGGAQAIAALTYGTESVENVSMIVGPGNAFVAEAKRQVYGDVGIDMVAGPSEILIVADEKANPKYIAADLMSQAEHDELASSILITTSKELAEKVNEEIKVQIKGLNRRDIIKNSLNKFGKIIICNSIEKSIEVANLIAPEHLELLIDNPIEYLEQVKSAGSVFLGEYTPEPIGDYFGGTNHVLPTGGTAKFSSPLSVDTFIKKSSFLY